MSTNFRLCELCMLPEVSSAENRGRRSGAEWEGGSNGEEDRRRAYFVQWKLSADVSDHAVLVFKSEQGDASPALQE